MTSAISSATRTANAPPPSTTAPANAGRVNSDGDHDGSKAGEVEKARPMSGEVGSIINTTAESLLLWHFQVACLDMSGNAQCQTYLCSTVHKELPDLLLFNRFSISTVINALLCSADLI